MLAWDGSVYDQDATDFAEMFYARLGLGDGAPRAAAAARLALLKLKAQDARRGRHWHLARVYLGPGGGGPLCAAGKPKHPRLPDAEASVFLDERRGRVPVAPRSAFVGRRRSIQAVLRAFRGEGRRPSAVLAHGMGALGKSSLAARVASRVGGRETVVIFERYDALAVFDAVLEAVPAVARKAARNSWQPGIEADHALLADALEALLEGPLDAEPMLLIVDDLERILETPTPGETLTGVRGEDHRAALGAILRAFDRARTDSRLLLTSRYDFRLPDGRGGDAAPVSMARRNAGRRCRPWRSGTAPRPFLPGSFQGSCVSVTRPGT